MASIVKRTTDTALSYTYKHTNGTKAEMGETFTDLADANRKKEVEYKESVGTFVAPPSAEPLKDFAYRICCPVPEKLNGHFQPINQTLH